MCALLLLLAAASGDLVPGTEHRAAFAPSFLSPLSFFASWPTRYNLGSRLGDQEAWRSTRHERGVVAAAVR